MGCEIIISVWNQKRLTQQCINSIFANTHCDYSLIVIDNASATPTRIYLDEIKAKYPDRIKIIRNKENVGNTKAANQGMLASSADYVCILDNDTIVCDGWLNEMIRIAESSPDIGIVNPHSNFGRKKPWNKSYQQYAREKTRGKQGQHIETATAVGFCFLIKRDVINKIGLWDERFSPGYFEDTEYSLRARKAGYRSAFAKGAFVFHFEHASFRKRNLNQLFEQSKEKFYSLYKKPERVLFVKSHIDKKYYDKIIHTSYSLAKDANWVWIFLRKSSPELNLYEHTNIKVIRIPSVRFYLEVIMRILVKKKKFSTIFVDDENLTAILNRLKRYHSAEARLLSKEGPKESA